MRRFIKRYPNTESCRTAEANYRWLADLGTPLRLPRVLTTRPPRIDFEFVPGRHARPGDLAALAAHLGDAHGAAFVTTLHCARLDEPFITADGHLIPDFLSRRTDALRQRLGEHIIPSPQFDPEQASAVLRHAAQAPAGDLQGLQPAELPDHHRGSGNRRLRAGQPGTIRLRLGQARGHPRHDPRHCFPRRRRGCPPRLQHGRQPPPSRTVRDGSAGAA